MGSGKIFNRAPGLVVTIRFFVECSCKMVESTSVVHRVLQTVDRDFLEDSEWCWYPNLDTVGTFVCFGWQYHGVLCDNRLNQLHRNPTLGGMCVYIARTPENIL